MEETLLEKAKKAKSKYHSRKEKNDEYIDLGLAWAKDEIGLTQIAEALGKKRNHSPYNLIALGLREAVRKGRLVDKEDKSGKRN